MLLKAGDNVIRDLVEDDVPSIARHADNPRIAATLRDLFPSPYSETDAREFIARINADDPPSAFAIANGDEAFGVIGYFPRIDVYRFSAEIGYWIGEDYWGRGIMTEVLKTFTDHLFDNFEFNRLFAGVFASNPASARVLEKAGFTQEGILRAHVYKNGEILDEHLYARICPGMLDG